jgi:hypothetical protein
VDAPTSANAFLYRRTRLLSVTHAPDPGVKKALLSTERQPSGGSRGPFMAVAIIYQSASRRCPADVAKLAPNDPLGVADTRRLVCICTPSGAQRPGRIQWPTAGTHGTAEDDHHGRSLRWLRSWRGDLTGATAKPNSERATTGGDRPWPPSKHPAAGGAAAARADRAHQHPTHPPPRRKGPRHQPRRLPLSTFGPDWRSHLRDRREHAVARP